MTNFISFCLRIFKIAFFVSVCSFIFLSCANQASPGGGDYDFDPPKVVKSNPKFNATNVDISKIDIIFDENIQIENPSEKVIITPPQKKLPLIQAISHRIRVELKDSLLPNTTYTIDFTDAISDYNEKNVLENFSLSFSTGNKVDSLAISGKVLSADNLEPVKGLYVGLHSDLSDTAFTHKPFERISRTNESGEFTIKGVAEGEYKIYALDDANRSYMYENPLNAIAFYDSIIVPSHIPAFRTDTIFKADLTVDTVIETLYTRFIPDNIMLRSFTSSFQRQYMQKYERLSKDELQLFFGAPTEMAQIKPLNFDGEKEWAILERSAKNDTLRYWIIDPDIMAMDTLSLQVTYNITDSINNVVAKTDTLNFVDRKRNTKKEKPKKGEEEKIDFLTIESNIRGTLDVYDTIRIQFAQPLRDFDESKIKLQRLVDSVYVDETVEFYQDKFNPRKYTFPHKWKPGQSYQFVIDSAAFRSYSDLFINKLESKFSVKKLDEYGDLYIDLFGLDSEKPAFVELLDGSDKPFRKMKVKKASDGVDGVLFKHLNPGKYYARIVIDENDNGVWDTGDYFEMREPETVYYCNTYFEIKALWQIQESWDVTALSLDKQKPLEITKNKPKEKDSKRKELEEQEKKQKDQKKQQDRQQKEQNANPYSTSRTLNQ